MIEINDDKSTIVFSIQGNIYDENNIFYRIENLYEVWKKYLGTEVEFENYGKRIVSNINIQDNFLFIKTIK